MSCWSSDTLELLDRAMMENFKCRIKKLDDGTKFIVDEHGQDDISGRVHKVCSNARANKLLIHFSTQQIINLIMDLYHDVIMCLGRRLWSRNGCSSTNCEEMDIAGAYKFGS